MQFDQLKRREFIMLLGSGAAAWPLVAHAQQADGMRRIGVLMPYAESDRQMALSIATLRQRLQQLGWTEGLRAGGMARFGRIGVGE